AMPMGAISNMPVLESKEALTLFVPLDTVTIGLVEQAVPAARNCALMRVMVIDRSGVNTARLRVANNPGENALANMRGAAVIVASPFTVMPPTPVLTAPEKVVAVI